MRPREQRLGCYGLRRGEVILALKVGSGGATRSVELALAWSDEQMMASGRADHPGWPAQIFSTWARAKLETSLQAFDWFDLPPTDFHTVVARIAVPTLLVTGEPALGAVVPATLAEELTALNPLLRVAHVPGAGHSIRYEQPEPFTALVRAFLAERFG